MQKQHCADLVILDALRGLAALYVLLFHARWMLWMSYQDYLTAGERALTPLLGIASLGLRYSDQAVLLFFLLSGFCIHYRQARALTSHSNSIMSYPGNLFSVQAFAWRRGRRLYPPLLVALALTVICDYLGGRLHPATYAGVPGDYTFSTLAGNLLLQTRLLVPQFGTDGPLWSLAYEFWFYALYPALLVLTVRFGTRGLIGVPLVISLASLGLRHVFAVPFMDAVLSVLSLWASWALGAAIAEVYTGRFHWTGIRWTALVAIPALFYLVYTQAPGGVDALADRHPAWRDLAWACVLGASLACLVLAPPRALLQPLNVVARRLAPLGAISYSLYVVHLPLVTLLSAWWLSSHAALPHQPVLFLVGVGLAIALAALCWYFVERHFVSERGPRREERAPIAVRPVVELQPPLG